MKGERSTISVVTLGCSKNVVDSEVLLAHLKRSNASVVDNVDEASTVVINTCGFIESARQESIDAIIEAIEKKKRGELSRVVVMGCLSERFRDELRAEIPEVDSYFGSNEMPRILADLGIDFRKELLGERWLTTPSHFAYLKISEGCDHPCSFCAIPLMRGAHRSKLPEDILREAQLLSAKGVRELILIGQDTTAYGMDRHGDRQLASLLKQLDTVDGIGWIRLMYAYPAQFPFDILEVYASSKKLCRYLDMPIQHISDSVLRSMRRGITRRGTQDLIRRIKSFVPDIALRTTLIVGYPDETEDDFRLLCDFVEEARFHRLGVFPYSHEEGTSAFPLGDPIPQSVKEERQARIMEIQQRISAEMNESLTGKTVQILVDRNEGAIAVGRTEWDAPEIDQEVFVNDAGNVLPGTFVKVKITDTAEYDLYGSLVPSAGERTR